MRARKVSFVLIAVLVATGVLLLRRAERSVEEFDDSGGTILDASEFELSISSDKDVYEVGERPRISATLFNRSGQTVVFVPAQDGSLYGRPPQVKWRIEAPTGALPLPIAGRDGDVNALPATDLVALAPGESLDVLAKWGRVPVQELERGPGEYRIQFSYSTDGDDPRRWIVEGATPVGFPIERALLAKVPRVRLTSNVLTIRVENPFDSTAQMLREGTYEQVLFALQSIKARGIELGESEAIVDALFRFRSTSYTNRKYEHLIYDVIPLLALYATPSDSDRVWELVRTAEAYRRFDHYFRDVRTKLVSVFLRSPTEHRYERLEFLLLGQPPIIIGEPRTSPKLRATPEIITLLRGTRGEDIERLLEELAAKR